MRFALGGTAERPLLDRRHGAGEDDQWCSLPFERGVRLVASVGLRSVDLVADRDAQLLERETWTTSGRPIRSQLRRPD